jgi:hypothetical protein
MEKDERIQYLREAQEKLFEAIELLELACENDANAQAYLIDHLKILTSADHGFASNDLNIDKLISRYSGEEDI